MEISVIADSITIPAATNTAQGLGFAKFLLYGRDLTSNNYISLSDSYSDHASGGLLQISSMIFPVDALAPPPVKPNSYKTISRTLLLKKRRTRRRSFSGGSEDGEDDGFFGDGDDDGSFYGGGGGNGGGRGWNFDRFGGGNWDESWSSSSDPALDFVYEVICWIALSNCVHFAFKKVLRIVADGIGDPDREKVHMPLTSMC